MSNNSYKTLAKAGTLSGWKCMRCGKLLKPKVCEGGAVALCEPCNQEVAKMQTIMIEILCKPCLFEDDKLEENN